MNIFWENLVGGLSLKSCLHIGHSVRLPTQSPQVMLWQFGQSKISLETKINAISRTHKKTNEKYFGISKQMGQDFAISFSSSSAAFAAAAVVAGAAGFFEDDFPVVLREVISFVRATMPFWKKNKIQKGKNTAYHFPVIPREFLFLFLTVEGRQTSHFFL